MIAMVCTKTRGQAAVDYLSTYGWAMLIMAIVLAALLWLGVFNPFGRVPDRCSFEPGIKCESVKATVSGVEAIQIINTLRIANQLPQALIVCYARCTQEQDAAAPQILSIGTVADCVRSNRLRLASGESGYVPLNMACLNSAGNAMGGKAGDRYSANLFVYYVLEGDESGSMRIARGEIDTTLQPR